MFTYTLKCKYTTNATPKHWADIRKNPQHEGLGVFRIPYINSMYEQKNLYLHCTISAKFMFQQAFNFLIFVLGTNMNFLLLSRSIYVEHSIQHGRQAYELFVSVYHKIRCPLHHFAFYAPNTAHILRNINIEYRLPVACNRMKKGFGLGF